MLALQSLLKKSISKADFSVARSCALCLCFWVICAAQAFCWGQEIGCSTEVAFSKPFAGSLPRILQEFSTRLSMPLLGEVTSNDTVLNISVGRTSLSRALALSQEKLICSVTGNTIHVYQQSVLNSPDNALNYTFAYFEIPSNIEEFRNLFKERINREPWLKSQGNRTVIQTLGGFLSADGDKFPLKEEEVHNIKARDLLVRISFEQAFVSIIEFPPVRSSLSGKKQWDFAFAHWIWRTSRPSGIN